MFTGFRFISLVTRLLGWPSCMRTSLGPNELKGNPHRFVCHRRYRRAWSSKRVAELSV